MNLRSLMGNFEGGDSLIACTFFSYWLCFQTSVVPGSTPSSHVDPGRLEFSLPPEEPGCAHHPWLNPRYSADPLQAILSPINKPFSNYTIPVAWITEPATDSRDFT